MNLLLSETKQKKKQRTFKLNAKMQRKTPKTMLQTNILIYALDWYFHLIFTLCFSLQSLILIFIESASFSNEAGNVMLLFALRKDIFLEWLRIITYIYCWSNASDKRILEIEKSEMEWELEKQRRKIHKTLISSRSSSRRKCAIVLLNKSRVIVRSHKFSIKYLCRLC